MPKKRHQCDIVRFLVYSGYSASRKFVSHHLANQGDSAVPCEGSEYGTSAKNQQNFTRFSGVLMRLEIFWPGIKSLQRRVLDEKVTAANDIDLGIGISVICG